MRDRLLSAAKRMANRHLMRALLLCAVLGLPALLSGRTTAAAQTGSAAPAASARQLGTVKSIEGSTLTLTTDAGKMLTVTVMEGARVLQLAPGSTDLKTAQVIALSGIAAGDRVLVTSKPGATDDAVTASRVILMKSTEIADKHATEQQEWRRNGTSGTVNAVQGSELTVIAGAKKLTVTTTPSTVYRRYAGDSVKYQDARLGTAQQIQVGDQISVRGTGPVVDDALKAEEIVSGSFKNLSGVITAVDAGTSTVSFKDLTTKQPVKVMLTANSDLRRLPPEAAARFAARTRGTTAGGTRSGVAGAGGGQPRPAGEPGAAATNPTPASSGQRPGGSPAGVPGAGAPGGPSAGMDLSRMLERLPLETVADVKVGDAVMIVASSQPGASYTAVTMLSGVEAILSATPSGVAPVTLSPWNLGAPEGGAGQ